MNIIEKNKQKKDNHSERLFESIFSEYITKKPGEFAIKTNQLIFCDKNNKPKGCGCPDFLLSINGQQIVAEVTTAHDLDDPNAKTPFRPGQTQITNPWKQIFDRINRKMTKGNFKNVEDFHLPITFVVFNNDFSSQIAEKDMDYFMNDYRKYPQAIKDKLLLDKNYWVIEKIPRYHLISGILFIESNYAGLRIKYFPSENNKLSNGVIDKLKHPEKFLP